MSQPYRYIIFWCPGDAYRKVEDMATQVCTAEDFDYWRNYFGAERQTTEEEVLKCGTTNQWYAVAVYTKPEPSYDDWEPVVRHFRD